MNANINIPVVTDPDLASQKVYLFFFHHRHQNHHCRHYHHVTTTTYHHRHQLRQIRCNIPVHKKDHRKWAVHLQVKKKIRYLDRNMTGYGPEIKIRCMDVNCALYLLQLSTAQKWKNRHLKQCSVQNIMNVSYFLNQTNVFQCSEYNECLLFIEPNECLLVFRI